MKYKNIVQGKFINRPNRFIANVEIDGEVETVHVKNTGRCKELLVSGATVYLEKVSESSRKTKYDLVAVIKERKNEKPLLINMDSQAPNAAAAEWIKGIVSKLDDSTEYAVRTEVKYGNSRFDLCVEHSVAGETKKTFIEVKGVTLEENGVALFPDAPTERGIKHIRELEKCVKEGNEAYILFVIQMKGMTEFRPNEQTHKEFADALRHAAKAGVKIIARDCIVTPDSMEIDEKIEVVIKE
ncbi:MAG: DNA/RNA nuclease SfsA [Ruminococcaceae bacterium]|nr:DNA/RNA nuclease SfsA [Oscillospiraceae bacterium]